MSDIETDTEKNAAKNNIETKVPSTKNSSHINPKSTIWKKIFLILGIFVLFLMLGGIMGFLTGRQDRISYANNIESTTINDQFVRGLVALEKGNCEISQIHFEYILENDANYPGAFEKLQDSILLCSQTATPTTAPSPTPIPTVSTLAESELLAEAHTQLAAEDWDALLSTLDSLRDKNVEFNPVEVDGLYYIAFKNRGVKRILVQSNLEGGIFDINSAAMFGPVDVQATNVAQWAELYITGASFWEIDWYQSAYYFQQVALAAPNLMDSSGIPASERFSTSVEELQIYVLDRASELNRANYACQIQELYASLAYFIPLSDEISPVATSVAADCKKSP